MIRGGRAPGNGLPGIRRYRVFVSLDRYYDRWLRRYALGQNLGAQAYLAGVMGLLMLALPAIFMLPAVMEMLSRMDGRMLSQPDLGKPHEQEYRKPQKVFPESHTDTKPNGRKKSRMKRLWTL